MFKKKLIIKNGLLLGLCCLGALPSFAADKAPDALENPLAQVLLIVMVFLALAIGIMVHVLLGAVEVYREKIRKAKEAVDSSAAKALLLMVALFTGFAATAQEATATEEKVIETVNGLSLGTFYTMITVIGLEILVLIVLTYQLKWLMGIEKKKKAKAAVVVKPMLTWWDKLNKSVARDREMDIDLNHDYDGISELDNPIPPWWKLAFVFTIVVGIGYLYRYHVAHSAPLQEQELQIAMQAAEEEKKEYLRTAANNVDENTVVMLDADGVNAGKALFAGNCLACHGAEGQGGVGPNLTDEYWLHGGDIKSVFKSVKYGWADKGMKSWKDDFSPVQIAQLSSFIKSLKGTKPANAKEPQGDLFTETGAIAAADSATGK